MNITKHIKIQELVDPETFRLYGKDSINFIDPRLPIILEKIRALCNGRPMILNTWHNGGQFKYRGYRPKSCTIGAKKSMHREGKAQDFDVQNMTAEQVRGVIRLNAVTLHKLGLRRIERGVTWVHIDLKETGLETIYEFNP